MDNTVSFVDCFRSGFNFIDIRQTAPGPPLFTFMVNVNDVFMLLSRRKRLKWRCIEISHRHLTRITLAVHHRPRQEVWCRLTFGHLARATAA